MNSAYRPTTKWDMIDRAYIYTHFDQKTWSELLVGINAIRSASMQVDLGALRHEVRRMGLSKGIQIRWSEEDTEYLLKHYKRKGNVEIARILTRKKRTYRVIDGKKVYRQFTSKNVEKKMNLLGIKRTEKEIADLRTKAGTFTPEDNLWTRGVKISAKEEEAKIWKCNGTLKRVIKIDGKFIPYTRWYYENFIEKIPKGYRVYHKDFDVLNDEPDNLFMCKARGRTIEEYTSAIPLLQTRQKQIKLELDSLSGKISRTLDREKYDELQQQSKTIYKDLIRIKNILVFITDKIERYGKQHD